jgi:oxygen-independent coproporphyrinogen-3 oxidase
MAKPGLYVHIPFCRSKCPYCGFFSIASLSLVPAWLDALEKEVSFYRDLFETFDTLYLGGGTPSVLALKDLGRVMGILFESFDFDPDTEITLEANPGDLTPEKIRGIRRLGVNRVNVGVQSFDDRVLSFLGRRRTAGQAEQALADLAAQGFENTGLDLIYGIPGQSLKEWIGTLRHALTFQPSHLSCYQLTLEPKTPFAKMRDAGEIEPLEEERESAFFLATSRFLEGKGYIHYEISNFAGTGARFSRHNRKYWNHTPYLGLGPSAHSFFEGARWWNLRSVRKYARALKEGMPPIEGYEYLTAGQLRLEAVALGLRTREGIDLKEILDGAPSSGPLSLLQKSGFVKLENGRVLPTRKGFLVADSLPLYLSDGV